MNASAFAGNSRGSQSDLFSGVYIDTEARATFSHTTFEFLFSGVFTWNLHRASNDGISISYCTFYKCGYGVTSTGFMNITHSSFISNAYHGVLASCKNPVNSVKNTVNIERSAFRYEGWPSIFHNIINILKGE